MLSRQPQQPVMTATKSDTLKKKKPGKLSKADISSPSSFIHVSGVSRGESGMQMVDNSHLIHDPVIRQLLKSSNIDASSLGASDLQQVKQFAQDANLYVHYEEKREKRKSIKLNNASPRNKPYSPPQHMTPLQESRPNNSSPSRPARRVVDNGQNTLQKKTIEKPNRQPPALPPRRPGTEKPRPAIQPPGPPPSQGGAPPPPPPPPAPGPPPPPAPITTPTPPPAPKPSDGRADLLSQIRGGATLKPVSDDKKGASPGKMDLNHEIRKGITLKPVTKSEEPSTEPKQPPSTGNPLIDALVSHLDKFKEANFSSDESESESGFDEDDDDW